MSGSDGLSIAHELVLEMEARSSASQSATTYSPSISFDTTQSTYSDHQSSGLEIYQLAGEQRFNQLTPQSNHIAFNTQNYLFDTGQQIQQIVLTQEPSLANSQTILQSPSNEVSSLAFSPLARPASQNQSFPSIAQTSWQPTIYEYVAAAPNQSYNNSLPATAAQQQYMMQAAPASQQLVSANNKLLASQLASQQSFQTTGGVYANVAPSVVDFILPKAQLTAAANPSQSQQMFGSYPASSGSFSQNCAHPSSAQIGVVGGQSAARTPTPLSPSGAALTAHANASAAALRQPALTGTSLATAFTAHSQAGNCFDNYAVLEPQLAVQVPQSLPVRTRLRSTLDAYAGTYAGSEQHQQQQQQQPQQVAQRASTQASIPFRLPVTYPQRTAATLVLDPSYWSTGSISTSTSTPAAASAASAALTAAGALVEHFNPPVNYQSSSPAGLSASASLVAPIPIAVAAHSHTHTHTRTHTHSHTQTQTSRVDPAAFAFVAAPSNVPVPAPAPPLPQSPAASSVDSPGTEFQTKRRRETPSESASATSANAIANANANTSTSGQRRSSRATPIAVGEAYPTMRPLLDDRIAAILGDPNPLQPPNLSMSTTRVSPSNNLAACGGGSHSEPGSDPFSVLAPLLSHPTPPSIATDASASTGNCDTGNGTGTASSPTAKLSYASASDVRPEQLFDVLDHRFASSANAQSDADANDETAAADRPEEEQHADQLTLFVDTPESSVTMTITERKRAYESIRGVKIRKRPAPSPSAIRIHSQSPNQAVSLSLPSATSPRVAIPNKKPRGRPPKVSQVASRFPASLSTSSSSSSSRASTPMPDARQNKSQRPPADAMASASTFSRAATASRKESASSDDTSDFSLTPPSVASVDADGVELVGVESASPVRKRAATKSSAIGKPQGEAAVERSHSSHASAFASISSQSLQRSKRALDSPATHPSATAALSSAGRPPAQHQTQRSANDAAAAAPGASLKSPKAVSSGASASPEKPRAAPTPKAPVAATPKSPAAASATSRPQGGAPSQREKEKERLQPAHPSREQPTPNRALATPEAALRDPKKSQSPRPAPVSSSTSAFTSNSASSPATATASQLKVHSSSSGGSGGGSASAASSGVGEGSSSSTSNRSAGASTQVKKVLVNIILRVDSVTVIYSYLSHFLVLKCCCLVQST